MPAAAHGPDDHIVIQAPDGALSLPSAAKPTPAAAATPRPAPIGLSVGFGAQPNQP